MIQRARLDDAIKETVKRRTVMIECSKTSGLTNRAKVSLGQAQNAAYVVVGLGVLGFQNAQLRRVELQKKISKEIPVLKSNVTKIREQANGQASSIYNEYFGEHNHVDLRKDLVRGVRYLDGALENASRIVGLTLRPFENQLPKPAQDLSNKVHEQVHQIHSKVRDRLIPS